MSVFINFKICDNAQECSGVAVCPTGALSWNENESTVVMDNSKCITCGKCVIECPAGAIRVAHNAIEERVIKNDYESDPRTIKDLMVERYGASPISKTTLISIRDAELAIKKEGSLIVIEIIDSEDTPCLINSVPIAEIFGFEEYEYYKVTNGDELYDSFAKKFDIDVCPTLLIFRNGIVLTRKDGNVENGNYEERTAFIENINEALKKR